MPTLRDPLASAAQVDRALARVRRRVCIRQGLRAAGFLFVVMTIGGLAMRGSTVALATRAAIALVAGTAAAASLVWARRHERTPSAAARAIEAAYPSLRNLAVTAEELRATPDQAAPYMHDRVMQAAAQAMTGVDAARVVPLMRDASLCGAAVLLLFLSLPYSRALPHAASPLARATETSRLRAGDVVIDIEPPAYSARPPVRLRNPTSVEALAGSAATIRVAGVQAPSLRVNGAALTAGSDGVARLIVRESGSLAIEAGDVHRVLPLVAIPDAAPAVRIARPGKDVRVVDTKATIPIQASARDDLGLRSLDVRYTIVSGSGEQFTFTEGTLPARIDKGSARDWSADATLSLASLKLEPGDALIYRAVASDARPGTAGEASSDTYFVEIAGPGDIALEGVDMPPDKERYALSEAMIVVKIQRLMAREARTPRAEVEEAAANIAAEQRAVRANFIFLLGGEVEDEVVEAEASHEIQEGRLANQARREIVAATVLMGKVEQALAAVSTRGALPLAQEAVRTLQRAFGHSRYLLRALPARIRIDPSRRLSGDTSSARDWRDPGAALADPRVEAARRAAADAFDIILNIRAAGTSSRLARLAERVLAIAPADAELQAAARGLLEARDQLVRGDAPAAESTLRTAMAALVARAQRGRVEAPAMGNDVLRLAGAATLASGGRR